MCTHTVSGCDKTHSPSPSEAELSAERVPTMHSVTGVCSYVQHTTACECMCMESVSIDIFFYFSLTNQSDHTHIHTHRQRHTCKQVCWSREVIWRRFLTARAPWATLSKYRLMIGSEDGSAFHRVSHWLQLPQIETLQDHYLRVRNY